MLAISSMFDIKSYQLLFCPGFNVRQCTLNWFLEIKGNILL